MQVTLLWLFAFWCLGYFVLPGTMNLVGLDKDDLSIANQAIYHVVFDLCQLGLTIRILFQQLKAFRPRRLGWFNIQFLPLKQWLTPVIVAASSFPVLDWAARVAQVQRSTACSECRSLWSHDLAYVSTWQMHDMDALADMVSG